MVDRNDETSIISISFSLFSFFSYLFCSSPSCLYLPLLSSSTSRCLFLRPPRSHPILLIWLHWCSCEVGAGEGAVPRVVSEKYWPMFARKEKEDKTTTTGQWTQRQTVEKQWHMQRRSPMSMPTRNDAMGCNIRGSSRTSRGLPTRMQTIV